MPRDGLLLGALCLLVTVGLLAGCLTGGGPGGEDDVEATQAGTPDGELPVQIDVEEGPSSLGGVTWNGSRLEAGDSERVGFNVTPTGAGDDVGDRLVVSATWDRYRIPDRGASSPGRLNVTVETPDGRTVEGHSLLWSAAAIVEDPEPGAYVAEIRAEGGATGYVGAAQAQRATSANGSSELLPDLVTMPVVHLERERPYTKYGIRPGGTEALDQAADARGCSPYEMTERGARNCLRFTNAIGNVGSGPLELRMSFENATRAAAPAVEGTFTQAVYRADGSVRLVPGGTGEYHLAHEHFHKEGLADFTLYEYDAETGQRGQAVVDGHKTSWCLVDMGLVQPGSGAYTGSPRYPLEGSRQPGEGGTNCEAAAPGEPMVTGVSAGWYDMYEWFMPDQYLEVTDLPQGTYELVSVANPEGLVLEADPGNNAGGVVFEWADGEARILDTWSQALEDE